ncbi:tRNA (adenosine(37)-N6)-threonylcarbamoyltransferase complex dimerization subunit type 1 TsaB [Actinomadura logoneensis]|uniref:tRNA (Adenosine(37)-N6)-threonylcarbamoyltransferase complex dimerization subunit type 1 TsaB n=1 Tax=Actinomadura logoneensis TaxID=2293572 RepID=A0A372JT93_9ACTN|nr:tRNA (adenosine(37)-N6)-threonylcarbamoyltransferase complex dimerization subunit type 1 TsaB [Actinomadura logoneensis]RFU43169.1 tRNA (adenosine(37)-N6)-threonylcarbamoyltransferase complex dimerization subunit type 1 TsaB [Actinomadura logoneensis]
MLVLAFDTATAAVTVALTEWTPGVAARPRAAVEAMYARKHTEVLTPEIARVLGEAGATPADLSAIVVGVGPGPYTGLRVGLVTAHAMGRALGVPVHGVCTLDAIAWESRREEPFAVATDARRREVYWARYDSYGRRVTEPAVGPPAAVREDAPDLPVIGEGAGLYADVLGDAGGPLVPSAVALADLAVERLSGRPGPALLPAEPLYLRRPDAKEPGPRKKVSQ